MTRATTRAKKVVNSDSDSGEDMPLTQKVKQERYDRLSDSPLSSPPDSPPTSPIQPPKIPPKTQPTSPGYSPPSPNRLILSNNQMTSLNDSMSPEPPALSALPPLSVSYEPPPALSALSSIAIANRTPPQSAMPTGEKERIAEFEAQTSERRAESREANKTDGDITGEAGGQDGNGESGGIQLADNATAPSSRETVQEQTEVNNEKSGWFPQHGTEEVNVAERAGETASGAGAAGEKVAGSSTCDDESMAVNGAEENVMAQESIAKATQEEPTILELILDGVQKSSRKTFKKGDVAIVMDIDDWSKTVLLSSKELFYASEPLNASAVPVMGDNKGIRSVFLLGSGGGVQFMPWLFPLNSRMTLTVLDEIQRIPYSRMLSAAKGVTPATEDAAIGSSQSADKGKSVDDEKVKTEEPEEQDGDDGDSQNAGNTPPPAPTTDWIKAYEAFFSIVAGVKHRHLFAKDASDALLQIGGVVAIAERYGALSALENAFKSLLLDFINNKTLYRAIAAKPPAWLFIGISMENSNVFEEALTHLIGSFPERWSWDVIKDKIPEELFATMETKAKDLRYLRYEVDQQLLTLCPKENNKFVSPNNQPLAYETLHLWRDYMTEHLGHLRTSTSGDEVESIMVETTTCDHKNNECLTPAGFYGILSKGGGAYLPAEKVLALLGRDEWDKKGAKQDESIVRRYLNDLKKRTTEIVVPLVQSTLQYEDKAKVGYLTCIQIDDSVLPWAKEDDDQMIEDEEMG